MNHEVNGEISPEQFELLKEQIKNLPEEKKQELAILLLGRSSGLNVVVSANVSHNIANANGIVLQVGKGSEKLSEDLKQISPEAMSELMLAIGKLIGEGDISFS